MRGECGSALVEHALLLALIAGVLILGTQLLSGSGQQTFSKISRLASTEIEPAPGAAQQVAEAYQPPAGQQEPWKALADWTDRRLPTLGLACMLIVGAAAWRMLRRSRQTQVVEELPAERTPEDPSSTTVTRKWASIWAALARDPASLFNNGLRIGDVMTGDVVGVRPSTTVGEVREQMLTTGCRHLAVCLPGDRLVGIISDRDLRKPGKQASEIMTGSPCVVPSDMLVATAITLMLNRRISCLPVVDDGRLRGLVTTTDLLVVLQCALQSLARIPNAVKAFAAIEAAEHERISVG